MDNSTYIPETMKRFRLVDMREQYPDIIEEAQKSHMSYEDFLVKLLTASSGDVRSDSLQEPDLSMKSPLRR